MNLLPFYLQKVKMNIFRIYRVRLYHFQIVKLQIDKTTLKTYNTKDLSHESKKNV